MQASSASKALQKSSGLSGPYLVDVPLDPVPPTGVPAALAVREGRRPTATTTITCPGKSMLNVGLSEMCARCCDGCQY
jgi:hypothetical protein